MGLQTTILEDLWRALEKAVFRVECIHTHIYRGKIQIKECLNYFFLDLHTVSVMIQHNLIKHFPMTDVFKHRSILATTLMELKERMKIFMPFSFGVRRAMFF